jgi:hypothetical protein
VQPNRRTTEQLEDKRAADRAHERQLEDKRASDRAFDRYREDKRASDRAFDRYREDKQAAERAYRLHCEEARRSRDASLRPLQSPNVTPPLEWKARSDWGAGTYTPAVPRQDAGLPIATRGLSPLRGEAGDGATQATASALSVRGLWRSDAGLFYEFAQSGCKLLMQEVHPGVGVTAQGRGELDRDIVTVNVQTNVGTFGLARFVVLPQVMFGSYEDWVLGSRQPMRLVRVQ